MRAPSAGDPGTLADALEALGDRWSLAVVDVLADGPLRFGEILESLPGLSPNILSRRLKDLAAEGILTATPYSRRPPRHEYGLSEDGRDLLPVIEALTTWSADRRPSDQAAPEPPSVRWA